MLWSDTASTIRKSSEVQGNPRADNAKSCDKKSFETDVNYSISDTKPHRKRISEM